MRTFAPPGGLGKLHLRTVRMTHAANLPLPGPAFADAVDTAPSGLSSTVSVTLPEKLPLSLFAPSVHSRRLDIWLLMALRMSVDSNGLIVSIAFAAGAAGA